MNDFEGFKTSVKEGAELVKTASELESADKESTCNAGDLGSFPGSVRSPGEGMATHCSILT